MNYSIFLSSAQANPLHGSCCNYYGCGMFAGNIVTNFEAVCGYSDSLLNVWKNSGIMS